MKHGRFGQDKYQPKGDWAYATGMLEVAGAFFRKENVLKFAKAVFESESSNNKYGIKLVSDPLNPHDENAIKIMGYAERKGFLGSLNQQHWHIGFVNRDTAKYLTEKFVSRGVEINAELNSLYFDDDIRAPWYKVLAPAEVMAAIKESDLADDTKRALSEGLSKEQLDCIKEHSLGLYRNTRSWNAQILKKSQNYSHALESYYRVLWLDQQGCQNTSEKAAAFSDEDKVLAPGIVKAVAQGINALGLNIAAAKIIYHCAAAKEREIFAKYNLRYSDDQIWEAISQPVQDICATGTKWRIKKQQLT